MPRARVPALLKYYLDDQTEVPVAGPTVAAALADLCARYPKIQAHLFDGAGGVRRHINLFVNANNVRDLDGLQTRLQEGDLLRILPSITGGNK
jgi:molybdopterin converting factor small subunit